MEGDSLFSEDLQKRCDHVGAAGEEHHLLAVGEVSLRIFQCGFREGVGRGDGSDLALGVPGVVFDRLPVSDLADPAHGLGVDLVGDPVALGQDPLVLRGYLGRAEGGGVGAPPPVDALVRVSDHDQAGGGRAPLPDEGHLEVVQVLGLVDDDDVGVVGGRWHVPEADLDEVGEVHEPQFQLPLGPCGGEGGDVVRHPVGLHPGPVDLVPAHEDVPGQASGDILEVLLVGGSVFLAQGELGVPLVPVADVVLAEGDLGSPQAVEAVGVEGSHVLGRDDQVPADHLRGGGPGEGGHEDGVASGVGVVDLPGEVGGLSTPGRPEHTVLGCRLFLVVWLLVVRSLFHRLRRLVYMGENR